MLTDFKGPAALADAHAVILFRAHREQTGDPAPLLAEDVNAIIQANAARFDAAMRYDRDFDFDYFGFKTLERSYLLKIDGQASCGGAMPPAAAAASQTPTTVTLTTITASSVVR